MVLCFRNSSSESPGILTLKDLLGGTIKEMMEAELDDHLGYQKSERSDNDDYRNGYKRKR
ncbi:transposase, partial [Blautia marasmi]|uniref:transposase n=1 Tax=Blautia marasmi TaxID=1917868 RepID=UPI001D05DB3C